MTRFIGGAGDDMYRANAFSPSNANAVERRSHRENDTAAESCAIADSGPAREFATSTATLPDVAFASHPERSAPTTSQLATLKLLAAGVELRPGKHTTCQLSLNGVTTGVVRQANVDKMCAGGWIAYNTHRGRFELTHDGRARVDVGAFVRAFSEAPR